MKSIPIALIAAALVAGCQSPPPEPTPLERELAELDEAVRKCNARASMVTVPDPSDPLESRDECIRRLRREMAVSQ